MISVEYYLNINCNDELFMANTLEAELPQLAKTG